MKLYSADMSPFAARCRLAVYAKGAPVDILPPPGGGLKSPEYLAIHPLGKVPSLVTEDGTVIIESDVIVEFIEDRFPTPSLRPGGPETVARARMIARLADGMIGGPLGALFGQTNPATRDAAVVEDRLAKLDQGLGALNVFLSGDAWAAGPDMTIADCSVLPLLFYVRTMGFAFGRPDLMEKHGKVAAYFAAAQQNDHVRRVMEEMQRGLEAFMARR